MTGGGGYSLKKRYFCDDANVDRSDPVQLHLVYAQCRDSLKTMPGLNEAEAAQLEALRLQAEVGTVDPNLHSKEWLRKNVQTGNPDAVLQAWKKLAGINEVNRLANLFGTCFSFNFFCCSANTDSRKTVRQLPTYGITTFQAAEKKDSKKLGSISIGITRDAVLRIDPATNQVFLFFLWTSKVVSFGLKQKLRLSRGFRWSTFAVGWLDPTRLQLTLVLTKTSTTPSRLQMAKKCPNC
jgi:hypothetical protein